MLVLTGQLLGICTQNSNTQVLGLGPTPAGTLMPLKTGAAGEPLIVVGPLQPAPVVDVNVPSALGM